MLKLRGKSWHRSRVTTLPRKTTSTSNAAHTKSEYYAGEMFAMSGTSRTHSLIVGNVARSIGNQFEGRPCEVHTQDLRVKVSETGLYTYPDIVALCGKAELEDEHHDTLLNPMLVIEVLSNSTEAYDRGAKFQHYTKLESVQEYVLISQDRMLVERMRRQDENEWLLRIATHPDDVIDLQSVKVQLHWPRFTRASNSAKMTIAPRRRKKQNNPIPRNCSCSGLDSLHLRCSPPATTIAGTPSSFRKRRTTMPSGSLLSTRS